MKVLALPGVFRPISDSWMLVEAVQAEPALQRRATLDLCTGSGIVAVAAARAGAKAAAVDVSKRALASAWLNARRNGCRVDVRRGHLFDAVGSELFDLITANPPYVPSPDGPEHARGAARAWEAGADGRALLDEICDRAWRHLRPGGALLVVHSSLIGDDRTLDRLRESGLEPTIIDRRRGPLGPLMEAQQRTGLVRADARHEDLVCIRAVRPPASPRR